MVVGFNQDFGELITVRDGLNNKWQYGKYAYLEQYFTNAYQIDSSGSVTTNSAGTGLTLRGILPHRTRPRSVGDHAGHRDWPTGDWRSKCDQAATGCEPRRHNGPVLRGAGQHFGSQPVYVLGE